MKIKNIEIENFKLFSEPFNLLEENLITKSLIVFNGPNGYGKTSIFDAIEFVLTGSIKRIKKYTKELGEKKTEKYDRKILIGDENKKAYIKLTLEKDNDEIEMEYIYAPDSKTIFRATKENNPHNIFNNFTKQVKINGTVANEQQLKGLKLDNMEEFYDKCCFISQDENLSFLKEANQDKANALKFLDPVPQEYVDRLNILTTVLQKIKNNNTKNNIGYISKLEKEIEERKEKIEKIEKSIIKVDSEEFAYNQLFPEKNFKWDQKFPDISFENDYEEAMVDLERLKYFASHQDECKGFLKISKIKKLIQTFQNTDIVDAKQYTLEYVIRSRILLDREKEIENNNKKYLEYIALREGIERNLDEIKWDFVEKESIFSGAEIQGIKELIRGIKDKEKILSGEKKIMSNIMEIRQNLIRYFTEAVNKKILNESECPLCGANYQDYNELKNKIETEFNELEKQCSTDEQELNKLKQHLEKVYLEVLRNKVNKEIEKRKVVDEEYKKLIEVKNNIELINGTTKDLAANEIYLPFSIKQEEVEMIYSDIIEKIKSKVKLVPEEISENLDNQNFVRDFGHYFDRDEERFVSLKPEDVERKKNYIDNVLYNKNMKHLKEEKEKLGKANNRLEKLTKLYNELKKYEEAIHQSIQEYRAKIISDIEPLLHVYTAKILQQKFNGKSIFIKKDEEMKSIQFINSQEDNHDVLYNMSSGQLAAVAIAFLLCMNKVYAENSLSCLLIDDPIQTIDDVNMVGLVDILRHEFEDRQIFISTHEQKFEWYLRYKYEIAEKDLAIVNMKKLLLGSKK